ncbi:MAG: hypothetical protein Q9219_000696 [cf. Caloplaca sp. 3 TL-2023]
MQSPRSIVVGIDFGTTYTAAAWADASNPSHIEIIKNWPTAGQVVGSQVPTEIAYDHDNQSRVFWGYGIGPHLKKIKWFKLCLELEQDVLELPDELTFVDVISDYLSAIRKHIVATLQRRIDSIIMQPAVLSFAITVPAIWTDSAKRKTQDIAVKAGMGRAASPEKAAKGQLLPQIFSEPECAAIFALKDLDNLQALRDKDRILVCDAGGGTVDVITYEIVRLNPLSITECTVGTGDYCGSTFIARAFESLLRERMGSHYQMLSETVKQQAMKNFEAVKMAMRDDPAQQHFYVNLPGIGDIDESIVHSGNFHISREEMKTLFDPVIDRIIALINTQVKPASMLHSILLVGGFGESEYLYQRLLEWTSGTFIRVLQPREASTAIVRGAVMKGLEKLGISSTQITRRARRWYGVIVNELYVEGKHLAEDQCLNIDTGQMLAKNQIRWFIRKASSSQVHTALR